MLGEMVQKWGKFYLSTLHYSAKILLDNLRSFITSACLNLVMVQQKSNEKGEGHKDDGNYQNF